MSGSTTTSHRHSRLSREVFSLWKRREKEKVHDIESPQEGMINFSTSGKFHGRAYASTSVPLSIYVFLTSLPFLKWSSLEAHTKPPYTLTLKLNGCIIFIAALSPSQILITSKHSLGPVQGVSESHAQAGERWLRRHLGQVRRTTEELAKVLWEKNWTAVAEVIYSHSH
jgi:tRNA ligase